MSFILAILMLNQDTDKKSAATPKTDPVSEWQFYVSGEVRSKFFLQSDEPDLILNNYTHYNNRPDEEIIFLGYFQFPKNLTVDTHPYFWYSHYKGISRIGLQLKSQYELFNDFRLGYGHHSWHNADVDGPSNGRQQDWALANYYFGQSKLGPVEIQFWGEIRGYFKNNYPAEIKDLYVGYDELTAQIEFVLPFRVKFYGFVIDLLPSQQFTSREFSDSRFELKAELSYPLSEVLIVFSNIWYYRIHGEDRLSVGIGLGIKFK